MSQVIAIVEDEDVIRKSLVRSLNKAGYEAIGFGSAENFLKDQPPHTKVLLTDVRLPGMSGLELLTAVQNTNPMIPVVVMSAYGTLDTAMGSLAEGAFDYLAKPIKPADLLAVIEKALSVELAEDKLDIDEEDEPERHHGLIGSSAAMRTLMGFVDKVAAYPTTVLLQGASGTGKERIAQAIHEISPRSNKPFVCINCGAIPETLLESELFGVVKGAYTGADKDRIGVFREAEGGTILLDEIGELPLPLQVKLLRVLQEKEIRPVGSSKSLKVDVRVLAASLRNLKEDVKQGKFREDLYFRLNVMEMRVPSLSERPEDIPLLVTGILKNLRDQYGKPLRGLDREAMVRLQAATWPGNVRQLENVLERAFILSDSEWITAESLQLTEPKPRVERRRGLHWAPESLSIKRESQSLEAFLIEQALMQTEGNQRKAAEILEISPRALIYKIKEYGLKRDADEPDAKE